MQPTRLIALTALLLLASGAILAQPGAGENLTVYAGYSLYPDPAYDSLVLIEVPFSLTRDEFEFFRPNDVDSFLYTRIFAQVDLLGSNGLPVDSVSTYFSVRMAPDEERRESGVRLFNKLILFANPGVYSARLTVIDAVSKRTGSVFLDRIVVEPPVEDRISLGGPTLAYQITPVTDTTAVNMRLVNNGFFILPNPVGVYSTRDTSVHFYVELYNPGGAESAGDSAGCRLQFELLDVDRTLLRILGTRTSLPVGATVAFAERFDIGGWLPGSYGLRVIATGNNGSQADTEVVRFAVVSPAELLTIRDQGIPGDPYGQLDLSRRVAITWHLLTPEQQQTLQRLSPTGKETFLAQYWAEHDPDPSTPLNEGRVELVTRLEYVNDRFSLSEMKDDGWRTDRGRIYLTYGPPDQIDDKVVPYADLPGVGENSGRPYQVWYYHSVAEGKVFVFVDSRGSNDYRLVHSNVYGEIFDKTWDNMLMQGYLDRTSDF